MTVGAMDVTAAPARPVHTAKTAVKKTAVKAAIKPLTQYALVDVADFGPHFRERDRLASILKSLGFDVEVMAEPQGAEDDEMMEYTIMRAWRGTSSGAATVIEYRNGEDNTITIIFATNAERDAFVDSMRKSGYTNDGRIWSHPKNHLGKIYAKVNGLTATLIMPFEMLPSNF